MSLTGKTSILEALDSFVWKRTIWLIRKMYFFEPPARYISEKIVAIDVKIVARLFEPPARYGSEKLISLGVKVVERFVPDRLLLIFMNVLDKRVPPETIDVVIDEVDKHVPHKVLSSLIDTADEYIPDTVANSRKISTVVAGVGKYVPDNVIPEESLDKWSNLKLKFHIPTLLSRGRIDSRKE